MEMIKGYSEMPMFLGFLKNTVTHEEFVAPVEADARGTAEMALAAEYPSAVYKLLTVYERREIEHVLAGLARWPGLPSRVQPTMEQLMARVKVGGRSLPAMPNQPVIPQHIDGARIQQVRNAVQGNSPEIQALAARLLAAGMGHSIPLPQVAQSQPAHQPIPAIQQPAVAATAKPTIFEALKALRS